jgi:hypothetical protein
MAVLTGRKIYLEAQSILARAGMDPQRLNPEIVVDDINYVMRDINEDSVDGAAIYVAMRVKVPTYPGERLVRPRLSDGSYLVALRILKASYDGQPLRIDPPMDYAGPHESGTTVDEGSPENVWIEDEQWTSPSGQSPSEQVWGFWPLPDAVYDTYSTCVLPTPDYDNWNTALPVRIHAHPVILNGVVARLFAMRDFHDNVMKADWLARYIRGKKYLKQYEQQFFADSQPPIDTQGFEQID